MVRKLTLLSLTFSVIGLFFDWIRINFVHANGFHHWSGLLIFTIAGICIYFVGKGTKSFTLAILLFFIPILSLIQFYYFGPALNLSGVDIELSKDFVQIGFYITFISSIVAFILYLLMIFRMYFVGNAY